MGDQNKRVFRAKIAGRELLLELQSSLSWRLIHRFRDLAARVAPSGSKRRQILMRTAGIGSDSGMRQVLPQVEPENRRNRETIIARLPGNLGSNPSAAALR